MCTFQGVPFTKMVANAAFPSQPSQTAQPAQGRAASRPSDARKVGGNDTILTSGSGASGFSPTSNKTLLGQ